MTRPSLDGFHVVWSVHGTVRSKERTGTWDRFRISVERALVIREWETFYEVIMGEVLENRLVRGIGGYAVVRRGTTDGLPSYVVVSVLTASQYNFNQKTIWHRSPEKALAEREARETDRARGVSPRGTPLTHSPFAVLKTNSRK